MTARPAVIGRVCVDLCFPCLHLPVRVCVCAQATTRRRYYLVLALVVVHQRVMVRLVENGKDMVKCHGICWSARHKQQRRKHAVLQNPRMIVHQVCVLCVLSIRVCDGGACSLWLGTDLHRLCLYSRGVCCVLCECVDEQA